jgi:hypothetical protein
VRGVGRLPGFQEAGVINDNEKDDDEEHVDETLLKSRQAVPQL